MENKLKKVEFSNRKDLSYSSKEAYKTLRTNIKFCGNDVKVIAFTSCTPNEGKSQVSFELGFSLAESGNKVIIVDADLRGSVLTGRYKLGKIEAGLTHYLSGQKKLDDVICSTNFDNVDVIISGQTAPNPSELLETELFNDMIDKLKEKYDYVILDTPPLGAVIDTAIIAEKVDGIVLVIANNEISYRFAQDVKNQIDKSGCRILGAVLNKVVLNKGGKYGYGYGKYKRYYGNYYGTYGTDDE
ncbi:MAG: CpsD/CapB family tyrosine-protein kinase [Lachnospiraceae bacterium]|nr:CpsD/CapB family tyrosine-protein kinase [Lachnospiraceae bacterium]